MNSSCSSCFFFNSSSFSSCFAFPWFIDISFSETLLKFSSVFLSSNSLCSSFSSSCTFLIGSSLSVSFTDKSFLAASSLFFFRSSRFFSCFFNQPGSVFSCFTVFFFDISFFSIFFSESVFDFGISVLCTDSVFFCSLFTFSSCPRVSSFLCSCILSLFFLISSNEISVICDFGLLCEFTS